MDDKDKLTNKQTRDAEAKLLRDLRVLRRKQRLRAPVTAEDGLSRGQKIADVVAATMGSWRFIIIQTSILILWITLNIVGFIQHWDPYPYILLNLALSFQAAYAAPFIMMSQNRQQDVDRREAVHDHEINIKAELEIELLHKQIELVHTKLDQLRENEVLQLTQAVQELSRPTGAGLRLELFVTDLGVSRAFYVEVLGFTALPAKADGYQGLHRDGITIALNDRTLLAEGHPIAALKSERSGRGVEIVIEVDDIEAAFAGAQAKGDKKSSMLVDQPWGLRDFRVVDPDGYYLRLTTRRA